MNYDEISWKMLDHLWQETDERLDEIENCIRDKIRQESIFNKYPLPRRVAELNTVLEEKERRKNKRQKDRVANAIIRIAQKLEQIEYILRQNYEISRMQREEINETLREIRNEMDNQDLLYTLQDIREDLGKDELLNNIKEIRNKLLGKY
ncbi:MAG: hypothetical protein HW390_1621 [Candidatus Brocadiaceae bacterium]|nr:hypothetical protein [Candidatus Brocadiaceae bacterium]